MRAIAVIVALLSTLVASTAALAHAGLVKAEPPDGSVLALAPTALRLTFNEPVVPLVIRLILPSGLTLAPRSVEVENATVVIAGYPPLASGTHVLSWRVTSADGHPVGGSLMFSVGSPTGQPAAQSTAAGLGARSALWAARLALYVGMLVGVGGAFFRAWISDPGFRFPAAKAPIAVLLLGLMAAPISIGLNGLDALDRPLSGLLRKDVWKAGLATAYGLTVAAAASALLAGLVSFAMRSSRLARGISLAGMLGVGVALALSGHASTAPPQLVSRPALFLHGLCVTFWVGSLLPLCASLRRSPADSELARFSRAAPYAVALLAGSGLWLAAVQLGRLDALWSTGYGRVLACKLVAVSVLLMLAAANRYRLVPTSRRTARPLRISIGLELAAAVAILALVALWRFTPPPRALLAMSIPIHVHGERAMAQIEIEPAPARGASLLVLDGELQPLAAKEIRLVLVNPDAGIEPMRYPAVRVDRNLWRVEGLRIPVAGRWQLRIELLIGDFDKLTIEDSAVLPRMP